MKQAVVGVCGSSTPRLVEPRQPPRCHRGPAAVTAGTLGWWDTWGADTASELRDTWDAEHQK